MLNRNYKTKKMVNAYVMMLIIFIIFITAFFLMLKYNVEGETNLPFELKNIKLISTATYNTKETDTEEYNLNLIQNNDLFFTFVKNSNNKKQEIIKSIEFTNFKITRNSEKGTINIYKPDQETGKYLYKEENITQDIKYVGTDSTDVAKLNVNNQGGTIGFSIATINLSEILINKNEKIQLDGTLLKKATIELEDIKANANFDIIIETESGNKFKANVSIELPQEDITEIGVSSTEDIDTENIVFKRI